MRRFLVGFFSILGFLTFLAIVFMTWSVYHFSAPSLSFMSQHENVVLTLTLGDHHLEEKSESKGILNLLKGQPMSVHTVVTGFQHAAKDQKVKGILLNIDGSAFKVATVQELRDAIKAFKATGKFIYTYTDTFGDFSNGTNAYYLAASTSKIWLMPIGEFNFNGMLVEVPFGKKALENFKIRPQMGRREEYKGMPESILESDFTEPYRQNTQRLLTTITNQIITDIASDRSLDTQTVNNILNTAPHTATEALAAKVIDEVGYKDQLKEAIETTVGKKPAYLEFESYARAQKETSHKDKIAIIYAEGTISKGKMAHNPLSDETVMDAIEVAKTIREAGEDKTIKAIVLRIDSGGGFPIPSELISREVEKLKSKKPVIVSMANYAASGGYWIACNARKIVAQPATLTGSIGVYAGKIVTQEFWDNYGLHWGEVHVGDNAQIWSTGREFTETGKQKFNAYLDKIYTTFQEKVAKGRNLPLPDVHAIAKGQVWTGSEAKDKGLVDELGGLTQAIAIAKKEANIEADDPISIVELPNPKSIFGLVFDRHQSHEMGILARYPSLQIILQKVDRVFTPPHVEVSMTTAKP
jgi:protease IV